MRWYQERVIVGSPGAGQYRVFSGVREHSKHGATMAQNGRQLPDAAPAALPLSHGEGHYCTSNCNLCNRMEQL
ncbi:hypothetical protein K0M31_016563 [Melipona bicolor]|uniref:Uncharacterized protein n=1 Tax=Melipona bicolor TaxID=60889 RepID=A0AA40FEG8_9HYME|nr:hypothetical protein K0M31_016563 [Melipona bicolor]